ncbi:Prophage endopeptidase tail [Chitinophaga sp. YR573]|uniref:phage tail protein n=1 Tax=Chitinophaga sp. YR573 TaxID=1881040 RepID=UPI0008CE3501|nr:phage tail protein [Chitinophaga sp. YR573]SEV88971.1 Prophage endopeptidase tail [Chitinophaga sp. YR573]
MIAIDIKRNGSPDPVIITTIKPDSNSNQSKAVMGDNVINLQFDLSTYILFRIGDWCEVYGEKYYINKLPVIKKQSKYFYEYNLTMQAAYYDLAKVQYMFLNEDNELQEGDFSLMGNPSSFIDLLIQNANRIGSGWLKGEVIVADYVNMSFQAESCLEVLSRLATQFNTEYKIEGKTIHLAKKQKDTGYTFRIGKDRGLYDITRSNLDSSNVITRLYAFGSDKNLPPDYRNYSTRLKLPVSVGEIYLEKNTALYGTIEHTEIFDTIYPHRTGKVTAVDATNFYRFKDLTIDFNVNDYLLPGVSAKVTFNTGQLAGYTFDIQKFDNSTKEFTVLKNKNEKSIDVPSVDFRPAIADLYVLVDIQMPESYVTAAEEELRIKAQAWLDANSDPLLTYALTVDPVYMRKRRITPDIGNMVYIMDTELEVSRQIRITSFTRSFEDMYSYQFVLSDTVSSNPIADLYSGQGATGRDINDINGSLNNKASENNLVGDVTIDQGTLIILDITTPPIGVTLTPLSIGSDGKLYKSS